MNRQNTAINMPSYKKKLTTFVRIVCRRKTWPKL